MAVDPDHCGECERACTGGESCVAGACACPAGRLSCDDRCIDPLTDANHCGTGSTCGELVACEGELACQDGRCGCPDGRVACDGRCIDPLTDDAHCGTGTACEELVACEGDLACRDGICGCPDGRVACGDACVDPWNDAVHCGTGTTCEELVACGSEFLCVDGSCTCPGGLVDCDGRCIDPHTDTAHCGLGGTCEELSACGSEFLCVDGNCTCPGGLVDCGGRCIDPRTDAAHCGLGGACEELVACGSEFLCVDGTCTCPGGLVDCAGRCIDPQTDVAHCGSGTTCAELTACDAGFVCVGGNCICPEGQAACTGSCIDILGDPLNCNGCGAACPPGGPNTVPTCFAGACDLACVPGFGDCDADPATGCETALAVGDSTNCGGCGVTCGATEECPVDSCVDLAPAVVATVPAAGAQEVSRDATITLTFSEPVDPTGDWFTVSCGWSGQRGPADFTVSENGSAWTLVPNTPFGPLETCVFTVYAAQVADEDTYDPADAMAADFQFSFRTAVLVLLAEDFEAGMPPGWTLFNVDGRTPEAQVSYVNAAWIVREDFAFNVADHAAFSTSWYAPVGAADDWLMTPALVLPAGLNCLLEWQAVTYDATYRDGYEVRISTTNANPAGALANDSLLVISAEASTWTSRSVSLAAHAGSTAYLAFRNVSNDKFLLLIDDVRVTCMP